MADSVVPVVMRGALTSWEPLSWSREDWVAAFKVDKINVRLGDKSPGWSHPQWERFTRVSSNTEADHTLLYPLPRSWRRLLQSSSVQRAEPSFWVTPAGATWTTSTCTRSSVRTSSVMFLLGVL